LSIREVAALDGMPSESTIWRWAATKPDFQEAYARAKLAQMDRFAEEILEISDNGTNDWMDRQQGEETVRVADHEHIQRSRLRVDARKWLMSKLAPKKYGDRVEQILMGPDGGPIEHRIDVPQKETREEWLARQQLVAPAGAAIGRNSSDVG
jgi:hypothetical protein